MTSYCCCFLQLIQDDKMLYLNVQGVANEQEHVAAEGVKKMSSNKNLNEQERKILENLLLSQFRVQHSQHPGSQTARPVAD